MKKRNIQPYLIFIVVLFFMMSLSKKSVDQIGGTTVALLAPLWNSVEPSQESDEEEKILHLQLENELLKNKVNQLIELSYYRPLDELQDALPARVIHRNPSSWYSSLWIDVGEDSNHRLNADLIQKNSPVLMGNSVIGVVDYVGKKQSRVRLITDSGLTPSVRAVREVEGEQLYLAKGELHGGSQPLWRKNNSVLKGIGFNYDFADAFGPARDLRTGEPTDKNSDYPTIPILQVDDLLVTTGMDGVFPPFLKVARVTAIDMLKEGDYFYELEAVPTAGDLEDLSLVFVIKPQGYDPADQPPLLGK